jgi:hypothetical protein
MVISLSVFLVLTERAQRLKSFRSPSDAQSRPVEFNQRRRGKNWEHGIKDPLKPQDS